MKGWLLILFVVVGCTACANNPYRAYLLSKIQSQSHLSNKETEQTKFSKTNLDIPRFERPKGAVFCRMEDYLTAKTKVWIKVGVK